MSEEFNKAIKEDKIKTAERELAEFLEKHPEYEEYQKKIDSILAATPEGQRIEALALLMAGKVAELTEIFVKLAKKAEEVTACSPK
jgi:hypothetical protein